MTRTLLEKCEIPISSEEKTLLQLAASMAGLSLSAFIRKVAISAAKDSINKNNYGREFPAVSYSRRQEAR